MNLLQKKEFMKLIEKHPNRIKNIIKYIRSPKSGNYGDFNYCVFCGTVNWGISFAIKPYYGKIAKFAFICEVCINIDHDELMSNTVIRLVREAIR